MSTDSTDTGLPFERDEYFDIPAIVGARWWNRELKDEERKTSRRGALLTLGIGLGVTAGIGAIAAIVEATDVDFERRPSLDMQRRFGWNFSARSEQLTFDGRRVIPFNLNTLETLRRDCLGAAYPSLQSAAIFDAIGHRPRETPGEERGTFLPIEQHLMPVVSASTSHAYRVGQALSRALARSVRRIAVIVDLAGPDAVALAAGMAETHAPVWLFDHWPHPRGVVPAHMTLASALFFQPRFASAPARRPADAPPVFIVDRNRQYPYRDQSDHFDNRYVPRLPSPSTLESVASCREALYVSPSGMTIIDPDDVNPTLVAYRTAGLSVRAISPGAFFSTTYEPDMDETGPIESLLRESALYYGGSAATEPSLLEHYAPGDRAASPPDGLPDYSAWHWSPVARPTTPVQGLPPLGTVEVAVQSGAILGARFDRNGSWNRVSSSGSSWGG